MTALDNNPASVNFLAPNNFRFHVKRSPNLNFNVQKLWIPGMRIDPVPTDTPFVKLQKPGEHLEFETLDITFTIDEKLANYLEIYNWKKALGKPDELEEYAPLAKAALYTEMGVTSEILVFLMNSAQKPSFQFIFHDCWPNSLSGFQLDTTADDVVYVKCSASFEFTSFDIEPIVS